MQKGVTAKLVAIPMSWLGSDFSAGQGLRIAEYLRDLTIHWCQMVHVQ